LEVFFAEVFFEEVFFAEVFFEEVFFAEVFFAEVFFAPRHTGTPAREPRVGITRCLPLGHGFAAERRGRARTDAMASRVVGPVDCGIAASRVVTPMGAAARAYLWIREVVEVRRRWCMGYSEPRYYFRRGP
jgi:hypothetical protein